jgi:flagellar assembly protein FliH
MVRRLAQTIEELGALRSDMMRKSERQLVQLAVAIASRVIQREITLDRELLVAMARVALDRLGDVTSATIRLHPEDYAATTAARGGALSTELVRVVADPIVNRGGCLVESDFGLIDLSVPAQVAEIANALLGPDEAAASEDDHVRLAS